MALINAHINHRNVTIILAFCLWVISLPIFGQQKYPVQATLNLLPPYTTQYNTFLSPVNDKMRAIINLVDMQEPSVEVKFSIEIQGPGIRLKTREGFSPMSPINLTPGMPAIISGSEWTQYFEPANLDFIGTDRQQFIRDGRFPEGMYTFSITVKEFRSGVAISRPANAITWLKLNDQPTLISPQTGSAIAINGPQNIFFQWQLNSPVSSGIPFSPAYRFFLYEMINQDVDPIYALQNGQTILVYESPELITTSLNYTLSNPLLDMGKKYMFRVQAFDPSGQNEFRDNGFSPPFWFYYGFPMDGEIGLLAPENKYSFTKADPQFLKFTAPSKLVKNQQYKYKLKIVEIDSPYDDPMDAVENKTAWLEQEAPPTRSTQDYTFEVKKPFAKQQFYAWQVTAFSGEQEIAKSDAGIFQGPPLLDFFKAGIHTVYVTDLDNMDFNALSGKGRVKIYETETDSTLSEVSFKDLKLADMMGRYVLEKGELVHDLKEVLEVPLKPREKINGQAYFYAQRVRLDKNALSIEGYTEYPFPHPVKNGGNKPPMLVTDKAWLNFDRYKPFGELHPKGSVKFELVDPFGFTMEFSESSAVQIFHGEYEIAFDGILHLNDKVKTIKGERVAMPFRRASQLLYIEEKGSKANNDIMLVQNVDAGFNSASYILDLSESRSPRRVDQKDWKGVYFNEHQMQLYEAEEQRHQVQFRQGFKFDLSQNTSQSTKALIDGQGLDFLWVHDMQGAPVATFNSFPARLNELKIEVENSALRAGHVKGAITIPAIDPTKDFTFMTPLTQQGFSGGSLDQKLENLSFSFNPYGGENKVDVLVKRGVFEGGDHLNLTVDITIPSLGTTLKNLNNLNLYGDYFIGFNKRNGATPVQRMPGGMYKSFPLEVTEVGAALEGGRYVFSYNCDVQMGEGFKDSNGKLPTIAFHSFTPATEEVANNTFGKSHKADVDIPTLKEGHNPKKLYKDDIIVHFENELVAFSARLAMVELPDGSTIQRGEITQGTIKQPARIAIGGTIEYGSRGYDYFYLDAYYVDEQGVGVTIFPEVNLVGFEGWIFSNMEIVDKKPVPTKDAGVGFNLFGQFIDTSNRGGNYQMDGALEFRSKTKDLKVSGDISIINSNLRTPGASGALKEQVAKEVAKEVTKQVLEYTGGIDENIDVAGTNVHVKLNEEIGYLGLDNGGVTTYVEGDITGAPAVTVGFEKGSTSLKLRTDVRDAGSVNFNSGNLKSLLKYQPNVGGEFALDYSQYSLKGNVNQQNKTGYLNFNAGAVAANISGDMANSKGTFRYKGEGITLELNGDMQNQKGDFLIDASGNIVELSADAKSQKGSVSMTYAGNDGDIDVGMGFDKTGGKGNFNFSTDKVSADGFASKQGILKINSEFEGNTLALDADASGSGTLDLDIDGQKANGWLRKDGTGGISFQNADYLVKGEANPTTKAGAITFENESIKLNAAGDPSKQTGNLALNFDGNDVKGDFSLVKQELSIDASGIKLGGLHSADSTGLYFQQDQNLLAVGGDPAKGNGNLVFNYDGNKVAAAINKESSSGWIDLSTSDIAAYAKVDTDERAVRMSYQNIKANAQIATTTRSAALVNGDQYVRFSESPTSRYGAVRLNQDSAAVAYDLSAGDARVNLAYGQSYLNGNAVLNEFKAALAAKLDGTPCGLDMLLNPNTFKFEVPDDCDFELDLGYNFDIGRPELLNIGIPNFKMNFGSLPNGFDWKFKFGDVSFDFNPDLSFAINLPSTSLKFPSLSGLPDFSWGSIKGIKIGGVDFSLDGLDISGFDINTGFGTIGLKPLLGFDINLKLSVDKFSILYGDLFSFDISIDGLRSFNISTDFNASFIQSLTGDFRAFNFKLPSGFGVNLDLKKLQLLNGDLAWLNISPELMSINFSPDISFNYSPKLIGFKLPNDVSFDFGADLIDIDLNTLKFNFDVNKGFGFNFDEYGFNYSIDNSLALKLGTPQINIGTDFLDFKYNDINLDLNLAQKLSFKTPDISFDFNPDALGLKYGDLGINLNPDMSFSLLKGPDISLNLGVKGMGVKIPDYSLSFDSKLLAFTSPFTSFNTGDLTFDLDKYRFGLTLINDIPTVRFWDNAFTDISFNIDKLGKFKMGSIDFSMSPEFMNLKFDKLNLAANYSFMKIGWDQYKFKIGLDTLFYLDYEPCKFMFLLQDPGTIRDFKPGMYSICDEYMLSANMAGVRFDQGIATTKRGFTITPNMEFIYKEFELDKFEAMLSQPSGYKYKLNYLRPGEGYGGGVGKLSNDDIHAELTSPDIKLLAMRTDTKNKIEGMFDKDFTGSLGATFDKNSLDAYMLYKGEGIPELRGEYLKDLLGVDPGLIADTTEKGENLEESPEITLEGPNKIGTIADKASGFLRGEFKLMQTPKSTVLTGNVNGDKIIEVEGAFEFMASSNTWSLKMGTRNQPIKIKAPSATFDGFLYIDPDELEVGFGVSASFSQSYSFKTAGAGLGLKISASYSKNAAFTADMDPFMFKSFSVDASLGFKVVGEVCYVVKCSSMTLVGVNFKGSMNGNIQSSTLSGTLKGQATILGVDTGELKFNASVSL